MTPGPATTTGVAAPSPTPGDIRDIHGPIPIPIAWLVPLLVAGALLLAALAFWVGRRWWRRRQLRPAPPRAPDEVALERLAAARSLLDPARAREFSFAVSEALRLYIEDRFGVLAARRTTDEFLAGLLRAPAPALAAHAETLGEFLRRSDLVKFARAPLDTGEMESMLDGATRFVRETRPGTEAAA